MQKGLDSLKSKVEQLDIDNIESFSQWLRKLRDTVDKEVAKKSCVWSIGQKG